MQPQLRVYPLGVCVAVCSSYLVQLEESRVIAAGIRPQDMKRVLDILKLPFFFRELGKEGVEVAITLLVHVLKQSVGEKLFSTTLWREWACNAGVCVCTKENLFQLSLDARLRPK